MSAGNRKECPAETCNPGEGLLWNRSRERVLCNPYFTRYFLAMLAFLAFSLNTNFMVC